MWNNTQRETMKFGCENKRVQISASLLIRKKEKFFQKKSSKHNEDFILTVFSSFSLVVQPTKSQFNLIFLLVVVMIAI